MKMEMAHPDCGVFRRVEDYRNHLPCAKCESVSYARSRAPVVDLNTDAAVRAAVAAANADRRSNGTPRPDALVVIGEAVMRALDIWQKPPC